MAPIEAAMPGNSLRVIARNAEHRVTLSASFLNGMRDILDVKVEQLDLREMVEVSVDVLRGTQEDAALEWVVDLPAELSGAGIGTVYSRCWRTCWAMP